MLSISIPKATIQAEHKVKLSRHNFEKGIKLGAFQAGKSITERVRDNLQKGLRSGIKYRNLPNRSSAPGENPKEQSGKLGRSTYFKASSSDLRVGATADHAVYLTKGVKRKRGDGKRGEWRLAPRPHRDLPFFELAMEQEERNVEIYLDRGVRKCLS